jgi:hypothetical protein
MITLPINEFTLNSYGSSLCPSNVPVPTYYVTSFPFVTYDSVNNLIKI